METLESVLPHEIVHYCSTILRSTNQDGYFVQYEAIYPEICARWIASPLESEAKIAALARIVPLSPLLGEYAEFLLERSQCTILGPQPGSACDSPSRLSETGLYQILLGAFRLLSYDCQTFARYIRPVALQNFFAHASKVIRYLAVRTFCLYVHAADHSTQSMLQRHVGDGEALGDWEDRVIDYRFLSLWEEKRWTELQVKLQHRSLRSRRLIPESLTKEVTMCTAHVAGVLLPRLSGPIKRDPPCDLIPTSTTESNLREVAQSLYASSPLLLTGQAGSGKTLLVRHVAWAMNKLDSMVTLHLNDQSDAKLLVGMYASGSKPGTFSWRPGVLTKAVKEGRWIFIEDLDRAPNEVISTLLPLIERGELLLPSRGETVRAARGFRIIATMQTTLGPERQEIIPRQNMVGHRFWRTVTVQMPRLEEFQHIISVRFPVLKIHSVRVMAVYSRLRAVYSDAQVAAENGTSLRALTPRDLLNWCNRMSVLLSKSSSFTAAQADDMFLEAFDCFAGSLQSEQSRHKVMACVAEELHIDPQRRDYLLQNHDVLIDAPQRGVAGVLQIGRARLSKHKSPKKQKSARPFSTNGYTLRLLEKIAVAVDRNEPLLLVGETGTGKTTCIQYLAEQLGRKLVVHNLSQQSESGDLLGGYKPVNVRSLVVPLKDEFDELFETTFSTRKNARFLEVLGKRVAKGEWKRVCTLWHEALKMVAASQQQTSSPDAEGGQPKKKRKVESLPPNFPKGRWDKFAADVDDLQAQLATGSEVFAFSFVEGNILKAVRNGDWVLLDEINLASPDTLEALTDLLGGGPDGAPSILLTETGDVERVVAHSDFRVFAAMNPATDVGKKNLSPAIRSKFTELYVESPDSDVKSLRNIVENYLGGDSHDPAILKIALDVTNLYLEIQDLARSNVLVDGADRKPHFSLRTLTRALSFARDTAPLCTLRRALFEGFHMSFLTFLSKASEDMVAPLIKKHLFSQQATMKAELSRPLQQPKDGRDYIRQGHHWLRKGSFAVEEQPYYIITPFIQRNLDNLIRATSTRKYPVLIQGPTSSGKTSMIEYLAKRSGNKFVRINNHEHTDLQEYLGSYISGTDGRLQFQEGILVRALREGHWIVLDELNLAPTDVLEALNRLLDDNRELLIPETQEVVRPHEDFMLFATQNPAGLYGGRKMLSRAFRNRFLELHFDDIPVEELTDILHRRTMIPESWCKRIVNVYKELSTIRQENRVFEQKSFATLRDLFRWAQRKAETLQDLANNGYMLLAERVRKEEERTAVKKVIETVMSKNGPRLSINEEDLYNGTTSPEIQLYHDQAKGHGNAVWTRSMRRLYVLVAQAIYNNEPVLLVGETGCGKTTVCQMLAHALNKQLHIVNAHQNTETGDLIGAQRPVRNRAAIEELLRRQLISVLTSLEDKPEILDLDLEQLLEVYDKLDSSITVPTDHREAIKLNRVKARALFEWADGNLVHAMKTGQFFLLDEISLADDSVLERLNSVLESSRTLLLAEKGPVDSFVTAKEGFQFLATMNPGGDYGKKELSPALRNRFTEIWVPALSDAGDILQIARSKLKSDASQYAECLVRFAQWFNEQYNTSVSSSMSIRDLLAWVTFINNTTNDDPVFGVVHGAAMVFIDTLGANPAGLLVTSSAAIDNERAACLHRLSQLLGRDVSPLYFETISVATTDNSFRVGSFSITKSLNSAEEEGFSLEASTTRSNAMRVVRALQLPKPILIEGDPGVGKTTLVITLAKAVGQPLTRLNLSEQTDLMDLFGSDVPVEDGQAGTFAWRDAPFLRAMKNGEWVLLDEMNLASQSVLEGLNAVLDHRGEVYISELDQTFHKHPSFRVFAAQNPHHQGGGRKGLPASFVNRFTVVYADALRPHDMSLICRKLFPHIDKIEITRLIDFVAALDEQVVLQRTFGALGQPWEFNLRDTLRWLQLLGSMPFTGSARDFLDTIFLQRFRSDADRRCLLRLFESVYGAHEPRIGMYHNLGPQVFRIGLASLTRDRAITRPEFIMPPRVSQLGVMEALMISVMQNWPTILVGPPGSGKTAIINQLASFVGADVVTFSMNPDIDALDLVGGYEQIDPARETTCLKDQLEAFVRRSVALSDNASPGLVKLLEILQTPSTQASDMITALHTYMLMETDALEVRSFLHKLQQAQERLTSIDGARFQWVDGLLIQALEHGKWLILDNANLCSSAVLDRLNSLLEPNGYLSINENPTADGQIRLVRPHPNFRIFMTMDPRYGELSRAMRNRAVEICLLPPEIIVDEVIDGTRPLAYPLESQMYRFRHLKNAEGHLLTTIGIPFEYLSPSDVALLPSFCSEMSKGLTSTSTTKLANDLAHYTDGQYDQDENMDDHNKQCSRFFVEVWNGKTSQMHSLLVESGFSTELLQTLPYHPLIDEILVRHERSRFTAFSFAAFYELFLWLCNMSQALKSLPSVAFERRKEKQKLPLVLRNIWQYTMKWAEDVTRLLGLDVSQLKPIQNLLWSLLYLVKGAGFDRARFQAYLQLLQEQLIVLSTKEAPAILNLEGFVTQELSVFFSDVQMKTGLGMERIWLHFRPVTPRTMEQLNAVLDLESLADKLDATMWRSSLRIDEMVSLRKRFSSSLQLARTEDVDATELVDMLGTVVREVEDSVDKSQMVAPPYFESEFEGLCQFLDLLHCSTLTNVDEQNNLNNNIDVIQLKSELLARRPAKSLSIERTGHASQFLTSLCRFLGPEHSKARCMVLDGRFHISMFEKLHNLSEVQLFQLDRLEIEFSILSQHISLHTQHMTELQNDALSNSFQRLLRHLYMSHSSLISRDGSQVQVGDNAKTPEQYREWLSVLGRYLKQDSATSSDTAVAPQAWIDLALVGLSLYVPNYPFDPALKPIIKHELFDQEKANLSNKLQALQTFHLRFSGQETSLRVRQAQQAINAMGDEPPFPAIVRPHVTELDALQGEFTNLLSIIQPIANGQMSAQKISQDKTLHENIARIVSRLEGSYRAYDDITGPAIGFLNCLTVGLALGSQVQESSAGAWRSLEYISTHTPYFALQQPQAIFSSKVLTDHCAVELGSGNHVIDLRWHALYSLRLALNAQPTSIRDADNRRLIRDVFASFYSDWKKKLTDDQGNAAKDSSLYTYRGYTEDNDEADSSLFPTYEEELDHQPKDLSTTREHAVRLANIHAEIFGESVDASSCLKRLLSWCSTETVRICNGKAHGTKLENALPSLLLEFKDNADVLSSSGVDGSYNFYFDPNLSEAKRLINLVGRVKHRYQEIRNAWPEHATPLEILRICDEVLTFRYIEPVAKFITKVEVLHGYIHEWQRVASREFSTANLYDEITNLLISWRQLELSTWARLFQNEIEKCRDDAKSWFFVAYETIIAASEGLQDEEDVKLHAKDLLKTMEGFFSSTTLGQFEQRIMLLQQFHKHVGMCVQDTSTFEPIHLALGNFIVHFSRFIKPVREAIAKGKNTLEKSVSDVIKLAGWKDTNIEALRQSAKTSHRKLTKVVRKFRALLNQPVSSIRTTQSPESHLSPMALSPRQVTTIANEAALAVCTDSVPGWAERPSRFKNLTSTIVIMQSKSSIPAANVDGATYIESFIFDLEASIAHLQKATPSTLTKENKAIVQHLKTRKRKLYADTMKELRQMGFRFNLSGDLLTKQDELSTILAALPCICGIQSDTAKSSEWFLHQALSLMPQVRATSKEHSSDLTANDVTRSIGFLEGILHATIRQRGLLSRASQFLDAFQLLVDQIAVLSSCDHHSIITTSTPRHDDVHSIVSGVSWLSVMLSIAADVLDAQAKLGKTHEFDNVIQGARDWSAEFRLLAATFDGLPLLPANLWCAAHTDYNNKLRRRIVIFQGVFREWFELSSLPRATLQHMQPFIFDLPESRAHDQELRFTAEAHAQEVFGVLDLILGSMQDVEAALKRIPTTTEDAAWLVKEEESIFSAITALHVPHVMTAVRNIGDRIQYLYGNNTILSGISMISAVQSIIQQYLASYQFLVSKLEALHLSTTKLLYRVTRSFIQVGSEGFCTPSETSTEQQLGKDDKLESGTGLGEGEGAEDISKDIEDDEDLEDLAQEQKNEREGSIDEEEDALDMGEQEMEGDMGEVADKDQEDDTGDPEDDLQSEVGSVDDLGPSAVDEKMWNEKGEEDNSKEKESKQDVGTKDQDDRIAAKERDRKSEGETDDSEKQQDDDEVVEMEGEEQEENVGVGENEQMDPHAKEQETLDLPEELNLDDNDHEKEDDELGDIEMDDEGSEQMDVDPNIEPDKVDDESPSEQGNEEETATTGHIEDDNDPAEEPGDEQPVDDDVMEMPSEQPAEDEPQLANENDQTDVDAQDGTTADAGADASEEAPQQNEKQASSSAANQRNGVNGEPSESTQDSTAEDGTLGQATEPSTGVHRERSKESQETHSFKKIGDTLERWYNQQRQIQEARQRDDAQVQQIDKEIDMTDAEFEHLPDEEAHEDAQALGTATEEQAKALDHDMAMAVDGEEDISALLKDEVEEDHDVEDGVNKLEDGARRWGEQPPDTSDGRPQAFIGDQKPFTLREQRDDDQVMSDHLIAEEETPDRSSIDNVETKLELTHLDAVSTYVSPETARALWLYHESATHSLSQQLTESLRLILAPTLATKLRGDFRTGKRLNLKRIIPYIASSYKRDKIWLRRSMPSKRNYQVLIALDDSRSMRESGAENLALKTLTLVTRSLSMLEVGEVSVVGFGDEVNVAHEFDKPFTSESGVHVFEQLCFQRSKTDVKGLVHRSLQIFKEARLKGARVFDEDLWQLMLIVSDGICDSHADIQRLVRKAQEERVMIVFIIIDSATASAPYPPGAVDGHLQSSNPVARPESQSILDLQSVEFLPEGKVIRWKYMERFPFRYYLVVRDVRELPSVLSGALRQWFGEVAGSTG